MKDSKTMIKALKNNEVGLFGLNKIDKVTLKYYCDKYDKDINKYLNLSGNMEDYIRNNKVSLFGLYKIDKRLINYVENEKSYFKAERKYFRLGDNFKSAKMRYKNNKDDKELYKKAKDIEIKLKNAKNAYNLFKNNKITEVKEIKKIIDKTRTKNLNITPKQKRTLENARIKVQESKDNYNEVLKDYNNKLNNNLKKLPFVKVAKAQEKLFLFEQKLKEYEQKYNN